MRKYYLLLFAAILLGSGVLAQGDHPNPPVIKWLGENQVLNCTSQPTTIGATVHHWQAGFEYLWNDGNTDSVRSVKPNATTEYRVTVSHPGLQVTAARSFQITIQNDPVHLSDAHISVGNDVCPGTAMNLHVDQSGGYAPYQFHWSNGSSLPNPTINPTENTTYMVTVTDRCGSTDVATVSLSIEPQKALETPGVQTFVFDCSGTEVSLQPDLSEAKGGVGHGYAYTFSSWSEASQPHALIAEDGLSITYLITDACSIQEVEGIIELSQKELDPPVVAPITCCKNTPTAITRSNDSFFYWSDGQMHTQFEASFSKSTEVTLAYIDRCGELKQVNRKVNVTELNSDFTPIINHLDRKIEVQAPLQEGDIDLQWHVNGVKASQAPHAEFELTDAQENTIVLEVKDDKGCIGSTVRTVVLQDGVDLPSAFSPNGDGINDYFSIRFEDVLAQFDIKIFDRWGQLIYHSRDQYFAWDGKVDGQSSPLATYAYTMNATTVTGRNIEKQGTISTLIID